MLVRWNDEEAFVPSVGGRFQLTHASNNLRLHAILILESTSKIADPASSVACNIRDFSNVIEHVPTCKQQDSDQTDSSPQVAVLNDGRDVGVCHCDEREQTQQNGYRHPDPCIVDGSIHRRIVLPTRKVTKKPSMHTFSGLWTEEVKADRLAIWLCVLADRGREVKQDGCSLELELDNMSVRKLCSQEASLWKSTLLKTFPP